MFSRSRVLSNPWKALKYASRPIVTILAGQLSLGFVLLDFNVSCGAQRYFCLQCQHKNVMGVVLLS